MDVAAKVRGVFVALTKFVPELAHLNFVGVMSQETVRGAVGVMRRDLVAVWAMFVRWLARLNFAVQALKVVKKQIAVELPMVSLVVRTKFVRVKQKGICS